MLLLGLLSIVIAERSTAQIYSNYTPTAPWTLQSVTVIDSPSFHTFTVTNNNTFPVSVIDVGYNYWDTLNTTPPYISSGTFFSIWVKKNVTPGAPIPIAPSNGWQNISQFGPITSLGKGPISITSGVNVIIPPGKNYKFTVVSNRQIIARRFINGLTGAIDYPSPASFTGGPGGNVVFTTGANLGEYWGQYPNLTYENQPGWGPYHGYDGFVTVVRSAPEPPTISVNPSVVCEGSDVTLTATAPSYVATPVYTWYFNNVQVGNGPTYTITGATLGQSGTYSATVSDGTLTSDPASVNLQVIKTPDPQVTGRTAYCVNEQFEPVSTTGQNVKWYTTPNGGIGSIIPPYVNTQIPGSYTFFASQTVTGCESGLTPITITVAPKPSAPGVTSPVGFCEGAIPATLKAVGQNLKWYYTPAGGTPTLVPPPITTGKQDTFSFWVSQTVDGCEGPRARLDAIVTFKPNGLILSNVDSLCQMQEAIIEYYGSGLPNSAYNWGLPDGATLVDGSERGPLKIHFDSSGYREITLQVGNLGCYSDVYTRKIKVNAIPDANISIKDDICQNKTELVALYYYTPTIDTFYWDFDGGKVSHYATDQGPYGVSWDKPGTKTVKLTVAERLCRKEITREFEVHQLPDAHFNPNGIADDQVICAGDSVKLTARTIEPASQYVWTPTRFFDTYSNQPVVYGRIDFTDYVTLEVTDEYGCMNKDSVRIKTKSCCQLTFPSAFSPNGDGRNDMFHVLTPGNHDIKTFKVVNRWGQVVFETSDERKGWDGNFRGEPADLGTYTYYINYRCNGKLTNQQGEVTLVR